MEGYRKVIVALVTIVLEALLVWLGKGAIVGDVTANVVSIINAIFNLIILLSPTIGAGIYMYFNVKQANQLRKK